MLTILVPDAGALASTRRGSRVVSWVRETLLTLVAFVAVVWFVLVVLSLAFGTSLVIFRTGSMSPTIPAGSVALVREVDASQVHRGDIVTVQRPDLLPVTHRVVSAERTADGSTSLVMRGDANELNDPRPYTVRKVQLVVASVPNMGTVVRTVTSGPVLAAATLLASGLITWAFWPRRNAPRYVAR